MKRLTALFLIFPLLFGCASNPVEDEILESSLSESESFLITEDLQTDELEYVYFNNNIIEGADPETHQFLDDFFSIDANSAYCGYRSLSDINVEDFEILTEGYATDGNQVYSRLPGLASDVCDVIDLDPRTFLVFEEGFVGDADQVFHPMVLASGEYDIDPSTFEVLGGYWYVKDAYGIYYLSWLEGRFEITEADIDSFKMMEVVEGESGAIYAQDDNYCYLFGKVTDCPE